MSKILNFLSENYSFIKHTALALDLLFVMLFLLQILGALPSYWNLEYIFYFVILINTFWLALKIKKIPEEKRKGNSMIYIFTYLFLLSLIVLILNQFIKNQFILDHLGYFVVVSIMLGFLIFYSNKNKAEKEIEYEKLKEDSEEKRRASEFDKKFPRLSNFNFPYGISKSWTEKRYYLAIIKVILSPFVWIARIPYIVVKWMYKEGWGYSGGLIGIVLIGFVLRIWNLGALSLWGDEGQVFIAAKNILTTGLPYLNSGYLYARDLPHLYLTSFSIFFLGKNEFALRILSVIVGVFLIFFVYRISQLFFKKVFAILISFIVAVHPWMIEYSRMARSYMLDLLFITITFYFLLRYEEEETSRSLIFLSIFGFLAAITHQIGQITLFFFVPFFILNFKNIKFRNIVPFLIILVSILLYKLFNHFSAYTEMTTFGQVTGTPLFTKITSLVPFSLYPHPSYFSFLFKPAPLIFAIALIFFISLSSIIIHANKKIKVLSITLIILLISILFSSFPVDLNRGVIFLFPFLLFVVGLGLCLLTQDQSRTLKVLILLAVFISTIFLLPETLGIVNATYGDRINPFHSAFEGFIYRQDNKSPFEFVNKNYHHGDLIVFFGDPKFSAFYLSGGIKVDYYVWTGLSSNSLAIHGRNSDTNARLINNPEEYRSLLENNNVWVITSVSIGNFERINHISREFKDLIGEMTPVYQSKDPYARVYYLKNGQFQTLSAA